jgi:tetratricopeptide (TPR) repeat protein
MAGRKKIIKKKLKQPDEFITLTEKAFLFIAHQYKKIAIGGLLLLLIGLSVFVFQKWQEKKEREAYQKFNSALEIYQRANSPYREGASSEYKDVLEKLDEVITQFPRTPSGKLSLLYKGNVHLRLGEFDKAVKAYQAFLQKGGKEKLYKVFAMEGLGYAYEGEKDYEKASDAYQKIVHMDDHFQMATAYLGLGRCYEKLGKNKEALENYRLFLTVSEKSIMTNVVLGKISHLENKL